MSSDDLPADNLTLSAAASIDSAGDRLSFYMAASLSPATRRAYAADLRHYIAWGGKIPAEASNVALYLAAHGNTLSSATLQRRIAALTHANSLSADERIFRNQAVRSVLRGIRRTHGSFQRNARPLLWHDLTKLLDAMGSDLAAIRDRAMLLVAFAGALRRSELVGLDWTDIAIADAANIILRRSKTDPLGRGRPVRISKRNDRYCPVDALTEWRGAWGRGLGPVFVRLDGAQDRLSADAFARILKYRLKSIAGLTRGFSPHSLRSGYITSAALSGVPLWEIQRQTGHATVDMVNRYIRLEPFCSSGCDGAPRGISRSRGSQESTPPSP